MRSASLFLTIGLSVIAKIDAAQLEYLEALNQSLGTDSSLTNGQPKWIVETDNRVGKRC